MVPNDHGIKAGTMVTKGNRIGQVIPVLKPGKERPDIPGHSRSMLHIQLYKRGTSRKDHDWGRDGEMPANLINPTDPLRGATGRPSKELSMEGGT